MSNQVKRYVLGFALTSNGYCVFIKKNKPDWQKGLLNGVGGKIEENELPIDAMVREFEEETSVITAKEYWRNYAILKGKDFEIYVYCSTSVNEENVKTTTEEEVALRPIMDCMLNHNMYIDNIPWLLNMMLDNTTMERPLIVNY